MANKLYNETYVQNIADAIRSKNGSSDSYKISDMAQAIEDIEIGIFPSGKKEITSNGDNIDVNNYQYVKVAVPIPTFSTEERTVTPTESQQTITPSSGKDGISKVTVSAIPSDYIGSAVVIQKYYTGSSNPTSSLGANGDLYLKV